jgi:hypothetical protein
VEVHTEGGLVPRALLEFYSILAIIPLPVGTSKKRNTICVRGHMMEIDWITSRVYTESASKRDLLIVSLIDHVVKRLKRKDWFLGFHFFRYSKEGSEFFLRFRLRILKGHRKEAIAQIEKRIKRLNERSVEEEGKKIVIKRDFDEDWFENPETLAHWESRWGPGSGEIFTDFFESVSEVAVKFEKRPEEVQKKYPVKDLAVNMSHYFLNPLGFSSFDGNGEVTHHLNSIFERITTIINVGREASGEEPFKWHKDNVRLEQAIEFPGHSIGESYFSLGTVCEGRSSSGESKKIVFVNQSFELIPDSP